MTPEDLDPPDPRIRRLRWVAVVLLVLGFGACLSEGANVPDDPRLVEARIPGFGEVALRIERDGQPSPTELCALLAATEQQRSRGLMQVTDLEGYVGMVFRFSGDSRAAFFMRNTPMPLSIAYFAADGTFVSSADMEPCPDQPGCPTYGADAPYRFALEVPRGRLPELGVGPGSKLVLSGACSGP
ncbi:MAG TPA: DUF192 domain-containing protein [Acidimicrobiales bacterium]|nr:DUF192 domain-containing protein [Acidimicrobiales bacterium]